MAPGGQHKLHALSPPSVAHKLLINSINITLIIFFTSVVIIHKIVAHNN